MVRGHEALRSAMQELGRCETWSLPCSISWKSLLLLLQLLKNYHMHNNYHMMIDIILSPSPYHFPFYKIKVSVTCFLIWVCVEGIYM
uniref:Uncharacterized protein n=1 Tax=Cucumis melo TaxID=3656 RepID=A0A9I9DH63_CUCME